MRRRRVLSVEALLHPSGVPRAAAQSQSRSAAACSVCHPADVRERSPPCWRAVLLCFRSSSSPASPSSSCCASLALPPLWRGPHSAAAWPPARTSASASVTTPHHITSHSHLLHALLACNCTLDIPPLVAAWRRRAFTCGTAAGLRGPLPPLCSHLDPPQRRSRRRRQSLVRVAVKGVDTNVVASFRRGASPCAAAPLHRGASCWRFRCHRPPRSHARLQCHSPSSAF